MAQNDKISMRQVCIMFVVCTLSPATRLFPTACSRLGGTAGWLGPVLAALALFVLIAAVGAMFKNKDNGLQSLGDVFERALGKIPGKLVLTVYLLWTALLYILYIRYYAERLLSTLFPATDIRFFILLMMALVFISTRGRLEVFARFSEFSVILFSAVFAVFYIFLIPSVRAHNILPITYRDALPALKAAYPAASIFGYFTLFFFLGNHISNKEQLKRYRWKTALFQMATTALIMIFVVGSLGYKAVERMAMPFFSATKLINVMQSFDKLEAVLLSVWVVSDFIIITVFVFFITHVLQKLFNTPDSKHLATPVVFFGYIGGVFLAASRFEMETFSNSNFTLTMNITTGFILPILVLAVGKLRKVV